MESKQVCTTCGSNELIEEECIFYCNRCGSQSQMENKSSQIHSTFYSMSKTLIVGKNKYSIKDQIEENKNTYSTYECAQLILKAYVNSLKTMVANIENIDNTVGLIWMNYLEACGVFDTNKINSKIRRKLFDKSDINLIKRLDNSLVDDIDDNNNSIKGKRNFIINSNILLCIVFVSLKYLGHPITYSDFINWIINNHIPFYDSHNILPNHMRFNLLDTSIFSSNLVYSGITFYKTSYKIYSKLKWLPNKDIRTNNVLYFVNKILMELDLPKIISECCTAIYNIWYTYCCTKAQLSYIFKEMIIIPEIYAIALIVISMRLYFYISWKIISTQINLHIICDNYQLDYDTIKNPIDQQIKLWTNWKTSISYKLPMDFMEHNKFASMLDDNTTLIDHLSRNPNNNTSLSDHFRRVAGYKNKNRKTNVDRNTSLINSIRMFFANYTINSESNQLNSNISYLLDEYNRSPINNHMNENDTFHYLSFSCMIEYFTAVLVDHYQPCCLENDDDQLNFLLTICSRYLSVHFDFLMSIVNIIEEQLC